MYYTKQYIFQYKQKYLKLDNNNYIISYILFFEIIIKIIIIIFIFKASKIGKCISQFICSFNIAIAFFSCLLLSFLLELFKRHCTGVKILWFCFPSSLLLSFFFFVIFFCIHSNFHIR